MMDTYFVGGRQVAYEAGVHMAQGRTRFNYMLDVNGDGLLDMISGQVNSIYQGGKFAKNSN